MSMESSIHEPFLLQSYTNPKRFQKAKALVYTAPAFSSTNTDGYVTVGAQADGIHILDVSSQHTVISHTLGPSTTFSCSPVTHCSADAQSFTTYAAIASSPDVPKEEENKTIWIWQDTLSRNDSLPRKSITLAHDIHRLHLDSELLLALSSGGSLTILDRELSIIQTDTSSTSDWSIHSTFCFSSKACSFSSFGISTLVNVETSKEESRLRVISISEDKAIVPLGSVSLPLKPVDIYDASCNSSGYFSILTRSNAWHFYQLKISPASVSTASATFDLKPISKPIYLTASLSSPAVLSLNSSLVLFAASTPQKTTNILIWDLRFGVVLASQSLEHHSDSLKLLPSSSSSSAILLSSYLPSSDSNKKSSLFVVPFSVPQSSTIAAAMGKAAITQVWLKQADDTRREKVEDERDKLLAEMNTAMEQKRPQSASQAFFEWEKTAKAKDDGKLTYDHTFVKALLDVALQPSKPANFPYSSDVVRHLLQAGVVSASMLDAGLLSLLRMRNDWTSIRLALKHVSDLLELEIIDCLRHVVGSSPTDAMEVDSSPADSPTLPEFLTLCLSYPSSPALLRTAIRRCLPDATDIARILETLDVWLGQWAGREVPLMPSKKSLEKNKHGVFVIDIKRESKRGKGDGTVPPVNEIVPFLQAILDSSLLVILQHAPAHRILRRISDRVEFEVSSVDAVQPLRGPLEPFVEAHRRALKANEQGNEPVGDWRQRSKLTHERNAGNIGVYQVERLVL